MKQGAFFEQLVECVQNHYLDRKDIIISRNQKLVDQAGIKREIDVLIKYVDIPKMIAIECKAHMHPVNIEVIDAFDGKCALLPQITDKIIASSSGFTKNAKTAAKYRGIELHTLADIKGGSFFSEYDVFNPNVFYKIANSEWNITFMQVVPEEHIKQSATLKNFKDDKKTNIKKFINHYLDKHLTQLCSEYIQIGKIPFETTIHIPLRNRIYIEDINGQKLAIRSVDIPIYVDISLDTPKTLLQKQYCTEGIKRPTFVSELRYIHAKTHIVTIESDYGYSVYFKNKHGELVKPTTKE